MKFDYSAGLRYSICVWYERHERDEKDTKQDPYLHATIALNKKKHVNLKSQQSLKSDKIIR